MFVFLNLVDLVGKILIWLIIARAFLTFFPRPRYGTAYERIARFLFEITEPILAPIRRVLPQTGMIDFSPLLAILLIEAVVAILGRLL